MAQSRGHGFRPSSPHSPSEIPDSFKGTPDTRLTAFSPEDGSSKSDRIIRGLTLETNGAAAAHLSADNNDLDTSAKTEKDPFVTNPSSTRLQQKLSPTASSFQPFPSQPLTHFNPSEGRAQGSHDGNMFSASLSKDLGISRYLLITSGSQTVDSDVEAFLEIPDNSTITYSKRRIFARPDGVYLAFADLRDAFQSFDRLSKAHHGWTVRYVSLAEFCKVASDAESEFAIDGVLHVLAFTTKSPQLDPQVATAVLRGVLGSHGQLFAFVLVSGLQNGSIRAIVEFYDLGAAVSATVACNGACFEGIRVSAFPFRSGPGNTRASSEALEQARDFSLPALRGVELPTAFSNLGIGSVGRINSPSYPQTLMPSSVRNCPTVGVQVHPFMVPFLYQPHFAAGVSYIVDRGPQSIADGIAGPSIPFLGSVFAQPPLQFQGHDRQAPRQFLGGFSNAESRRQNATRIARGPPYNMPNNHNQVEVERIRSGQDVRTTIMLRNIPNKVTQADLKHIVDQSSLGKYDFMYLRIDFANDCNVGYAFINFVDPLDIVDFVNARRNQRWNCYKSDKVAEISYATIQGKDCLVQKFRNSSVMLEAPHYRPKLYYTFNGLNPLLAGEEEPFPEPDNASKMKRSCENAEHVGLFTPNAGQHFRDEQRRRRSQFDRGTRLAALEEYDYDAAAMHGLYPSR